MAQTSGLSLQPTVSTQQPFLKPIRVQRHLWALAPADSALEYDSIMAMPSM
jgi:hypothetical protein